jgi:hypothetical protein
MTYEIPVPSNSETYSLVGDLAAMGNTITQYLNQLAELIGNKPDAGSSPGFSSITVNGTGQFNKVIVNGTIPNSSLINTTSGFGMNANGAYLLYQPSGPWWRSSSHIYIPGGGSGHHAINFVDLGTALAPILTRLTNLEQTASSLGGQYVTQSAFDASQKAQNDQIAIRATTTQLAGKVNTFGPDVNKAPSAVTADTATTVTGRAADSSKVMGRMVTVGTINVGSVPGATSKTVKITYPARPAGTVPVVFAQATADDGAVSIICSVDDISLSSANVRYRNLNASAAESTFLNWLVI